MTNRWMRQICTLAAVSLLLYGTSFLGFQYPWLNTTFFYLILGATIFAVIRAPSYAVAIVLAELIIGAKGYLFSIALFGQAVPIRYALFAVLCLAWLVYALREKKVVFWETPYRWTSIVLLGSIALSAIIGLVQNEKEVWFFDLNGYFYFAFALPLFQFIKTREHLKQLSVWGSGSLLALLLFTFFLNILFATVYYRPNIVNATRVDAEQLAKLEDVGGDARLSQTTKLSDSKIFLNANEISEDRPIVYRWVSDAGIAEISYFSGRIFRVFSISHLYILIAFFPVFLLLLYQQKLRSFPRWHHIALFLIGLGLFVGFSRSFWFGLGIGGALLFLQLPRLQKKKMFLTSILASFLLLGVLRIVPGAWEASVGRLSSVFTPKTELAASNRLQLLPKVMEKIDEAPIFGSGFGSLVRYRSLIPGTDEVETVAVYLYEWGFLDIIVKMGALGLCVYLIFLGNIFRQGIRTRWEDNLDPLRISLVSALGAVVAAHTFTPYLNHPIGISAVLLIALCLSILPHTSHAK